MFVSNHQPSKVLQPRKKSFNFPSTPIAPQFSAILSRRLFTIRAMRRNHFNSFFSKSLIDGSLSYALSPISKSGTSSINLFSSVCSTSLTSCGLALVTHTAIGRPAPSATAMSFEPLPRLVFPTPGPLFLPAQNCRQ